MMRKMLLTVLLVLFSQVAFAVQVPVSKMQNAMAGVTQQKMQSNGFLAADPRYNRTQVAIGGLAIGYAAEAVAVTALGITAPAWASVAAIAIGGYAAMLAIDAGVKWILKDKNGVQIGDNPASVNTPAGLPAPGTIYCVGSVCSANQSAACVNYPLTSGSNEYFTFTYAYVLRGTQCIQIRTTSTGVVSEGVWGYVEPFTNNKSLCPGIGLTAATSGCPASNFPELPPAPVKTISDAAADLTAPQKAAPLNPQIIADLANDFWREAATAPGYDGLPYDATKPITATEAATWQAANPTSWPSVGDFVAPQAAPSGGTASSPFVMPLSPSPVTTADPTTNPTTGTNPSTEPLQNLGTDPGIGSPALEPIPTAQQILAPLLDLFPSLRNFVVPNHNAVCPKWTMHLFDRDIVAQDHCAMIEQVRPMAYSTMAAVWLILALFIVLAA